MSLEVMQYVQRIEASRFDVRLEPTAVSEIFDMAVEEATLRGAG